MPVFYSTLVRRNSCDKSSQAVINVIFAVFSTRQLKKDVQPVYTKNTFVLDSRLVEWKISSFTIARMKTFIICILFSFDHSSMFSTHAATSRIGNQGTKTFSEHEVHTLFEDCCHFYPFDIFENVKMLNKLSVLITKYIFCTNVI